jgi:hypothetical protein
MASRQAAIKQNLGSNRRVSSPGGLSGDFQAGLGKQLSSRVSSGAIDQQQAQKVATQRALLAKAFGPNWRTKVYGDAGYVGRVRKNLSAGKDTEQNSALYKNLMQQRSKALERARQKLA